MTTIAAHVARGVMAADSQTTISTEEGGSRKHRCEKIYRKRVGRREHIVGLAGESYPGLIFLDWYGSGKSAPSSLLEGEADFSALVLTPDGLYEYDKWCRGEKVIEPFYAIGSGAKAALGAMHMGAGARRAVEVACLVDANSSPPVVSMRLRPCAAR